MRSRVLNGNESRFSWIDTGSMNKERSLSRLDLSLTLVNRGKCKTNGSVLFYNHRKTFR